MLIEFRFKNYRSFRDEAVLSMEAAGLSSFKNCLIPLSSTVKLLPAIAIYGKNGGGKSNVIRAFWLAVQFIRNAQRTQHERAAKRDGYVSPGERDQLREHARAVDDLIARLYHTSRGNLPPPPPPYRGDWR